MASRIRPLTINIGNLVAPLLTILLWLSAGPSAAPEGAHGPQQSAKNTPSPSSNPAGSAQQNQSSQAASAKAQLPRGKKLILKDGNVILIREYQVMDDRVRLYSTERSQWEEIPAALVDWDATRQNEAEQKKGDTELLKTVHKQELVRQVMALDVDASLEAAPGVFIPPGEGLFVYDGKSVLRLGQAHAEDKLNKPMEVAVILTPVHVIPSRKTLSLHGSHSEVRVNNEQPEFYMRTADQREPNMLLIRTKVHPGSRVIEDVDTYFERTAHTRRNEIGTQRWHIANGVYRFTISEKLPPGEYVFTEIVKSEGTDLYVWDFGVDESGKVSGGVKQKSK